MIQHILDFLGFDYVIVWTDELLATVLPVVIVVACVLTFYILMCFFQLIFKLLKPKG